MLTKADQEGSRRTGDTMRPVRVRLERPAEETLTSPSDQRGRAPGRVPAANPALCRVLRVAAGGGVS